MDMLIEHCEVTPGEQLEECVSRDIKDNKLLACGVAAQAGYIVTGDEDLLIIKEFSGVIIVTPRQFLEIIQEKN